MLRTVKRLFDLFGKSESGMETGCRHRLRAGRYFGTAIMLGLVLLWLAAPQVVYGQTGEPSTFEPPAMHLFLPQVQEGRPVAHVAGCPEVSLAAYSSVPVIGPPSARAAVQNPDINLALRGYARTQEALQLLDIGGPTDPQAPQLAWVFSDRRAPVIAAVYRVYDWDWPCGPDGCKGPLIAEPPVTLVGLQTQPEEAIAIPWREPQIYSGGYIALVLYAEENRLTFTYTREDNPAVGYLVHMEDLCVDPNLLALYRRFDGEGRRHLPALRPQETVGTASLSVLKIAIRDTGSFMDPRSRKDWWAEY